MGLFSVAPVTSACMILLAAAVYTDLRCRLIPNPLVVSGAVTGLTFHLLHMPVMHGLDFSFKGMAAGFLLLIIPYIKSWMGAGDVKFFSALGAWLGPGEIFTLFLCSSLAGGVMAAFVIIQNRIIRQRGHYPESGPELHDNRQKALPGMPYALAFAGGFTIRLIWGNIW